MELQVYTHYRNVPRLGMRPLHHLKESPHAPLTLCGVAVQFTNPPTATLEEVLDPDSPASAMTCQTCLRKRVRREYPRRR